MTKKHEAIKVGIAGLGRSGWHIHCRLLEPLSKQYQIVAAFDQDPKRRHEATQRFGCRVYGDYLQLLKDKEVELVINALPSNTHAEYSIKALKAGKHVVCEKPMAICAREADRMIAWSERTGRVLTIFQNRRYFPDFLMIQKVIASGVLGRIVLIRIAEHNFNRRWDWQTLQAYGGGTLYNVGPHYLDQALLLLGDVQPATFYKLEKALTLGDAEDHVKMVLTAPNSPTLDIEITAACAYPQDTWLIMGTQGGLRGSMTQLAWKYFNPEKLPRRRADVAPTKNRSYNEEKIPFVEKTWSLEEDKTPGETGFYLDLYDTLRHGHALKITPQSVRRHIAILESCRKSMVEKT